MMNSEGLERDAIKKLREDLAARSAAKALSDVGTRPIVQGVSDELPSALIDAKLAVVEARTDTKFAELRGDLRSIDGKLSGLPNTFTVTATIFGTGIAIVAAILASLALGSTLFSQGFSASDIAHKAAADAVAQVRAAPSSAAP